MGKPFLIFRAGQRSARKCCALLLAFTLLLALSVGLYRLQQVRQGSMEVFAGEGVSDSRPQGLYALLEQMLGDG